MNTLKEIGCPKCQWQPQEHDAWCCTCGNTWNLFSTQGICPNCDRLWIDTQCPSCEGWSAHVAWYQGVETALNDELKHLEAPQKRQPLQFGVLSGLMMEIRFHSNEIYKIPVHDN